MPNYPVTAEITQTNIEENSLSVEKANLFYMVGHVSCCSIWSKTRRLHYHPSCVEYRPLAPQMAWEDLAALTSQQRGYYITFHLRKAKLQIGLLSYTFFFHLGRICKEMTFESILGFLFVIIITVISIISTNVLFVIIIAVISITLIHSQYHFIFIQYWQLFRDYHYHYQLLYIDCQNYYHHLC